MSRAEAVERLLRLVPKRYQAAGAGPSELLLPFAPLIEELLPGGRAVRQLLDGGRLEALAVAFPGSQNTREQVLVLCSGEGLNVRAVNLKALAHDHAVFMWGNDTVLFGYSKVVGRIGWPEGERTAPAGHSPEARAWRAIAPGEHAISAFDFAGGLGATFDFGERLCTRLITPTMPLIGLGPDQGEPMANGARRALADVPGLRIELESANDDAITLRFSSDSLDLRTFIDVTSKPICGRPSQWGEVTLDMAEIEAEIEEEAAVERQNEARERVHSAEDELEQLYAMGELETERGNYESALALYLTFFRRSRGVERWVGVRRSFLLGKIDDLWDTHRCKTAEGAVERLIIGHEEACARGDASFEDLVEWDELIHYAYRTSFAKRRLQLIDRLRLLDDGDVARQAQAQAQFFLHAELLRAKRYDDLFFWATGTLTELDESEAPDADLFARAHRAFDVLAHLPHAGNVRTAFATFMQRTPQAERYRRAALLVRALIKTDFAAAAELCLEVARGALSGAQYGKLAKLWASRPAKA